MKNDASRKELAEQYKNRKKVGGVYAVRNTQKNRLLLESTVDLHGIRSRFDFAQKTNSCVDMKLQKDWSEQNGDWFVLEVLEELEKGESQTDDGFKADIKLLRELWLEKLAGESLY